MLLTEAIKSTFERRGTEVPAGTPLALTDEFSRDTQKSRQWQAFLKKSGLEHDQATLDAVAADLARFLIAPLQAVTTAQPFRSEEHTSELQSHSDLVCSLHIEKIN